jgi:hypothetical protein
MFSGDKGRTLATCAGLRPVCIMNESTTLGVIAPG